MRAGAGRPLLGLHGSHSRLHCGVNILCRGGRDASNHLLCGWAHNLQSGGGGGNTKEAEPPTM